MSDVWCLDYQKPSAHTVSGCGIASVSPERDWSPHCLLVFVFISGVWQSRSCSVKLTHFFTSSQAVFLVLFVFFFHLPPSCLINSFPFRRDRRLALDQILNSCYILRVYLNSDTSKTFFDGILNFSSLSNVKCYLGLFMFSWFKSHPCSRVCSCTYTATRALYKGMEITGWCWVAVETRRLTSGKDAVSEVFLFWLYLFLYVDWSWQWVWPHL